MYSKKQKIDWDRLKRAQWMQDLILSILALIAMMVFGLAWFVGACPPV